MLTFYFIFLTRISNLVVAMDSVYQSCIETDLATLHYVVFIEPFGVFSTDPLSFDSDQFMSNFADKILESKNEDPFVLLEEHFFQAIIFYKKYYDFEFKDLSHEVVDFFHRFNMSGLFLVIIKC
jgi:hypothetical protein